MLAKNLAHIGNNHIRMMSDLSHISKKHRECLSVIGYTYLKNNKTEKAIIVYEALWRLFPESSSFSFCLSYLYLRTGQYETALLFADRYLAIQKNSMVLGHLLRSQVLDKLGMDAEAKKSAAIYLNAMSKSK